MPDLNQDQFFHGTVHAIKGGTVLPANAADKNVSEYSMGDPGDMSEGDHAFAVRNDENYAWHAANTFHPSLRRSRVYEVDAPADMKPGPWNKEHPDFLAHHELDVDESWLEHPANRRAHEDEVSQARAKHQDEWASQSGFPVKKRIDIMPGRQGTFPGVSWGRFSERPVDQHTNHPTDSQVRYGLNAHRMLDQAHNLNQNQFKHDWRADPAPHSELREMAGRPQKRWATLFD